MLPRFPRNPLKKNFTRIFIACLSDDALLSESRSLLLRVDKSCLFLKVGYNNIPFGVIVHRLRELEFEIFRRKKN